jgi:nitrogenase molybdenum-iron protein alpha/beta subunit
MTRDPSTLPPTFVALRAEDESFWQDQERNIQGALGQPCCTLSGIASGLLRIRGHFAIVIHGEDECAGCFRHLGPQMVNLFCTGLTEQEFVTGRTSEPLRRCLDAVCAEVQPEGIFVLGACPVEVIGDTFEDVVAEVARRHPAIPMVALHTSGLKVGTQTAMLDWMFEQLASLPPKPTPAPSWRRAMGHAALGALDHALGARTEAPALPPPPEQRPTIALLGLPPWHPRGRMLPEYVGVLDRAGIEVLANFPHNASFDDWRAIRTTAATFVADRSLYPKLGRVLSRDARPFVEVPLPVGLQATDAFYAAIGQATDRGAEIERAVADVRARATESIATFKGRFEGVKLAYGLRMNNNYNADELAYQGTGDLTALEELGFDITLLVQGPPDKREKFGQLFERRGLHFKFDMFAEPWILGEVLRDGGFEIACLADFARSEAQRARIPMFPVRRLEACYDGIVDNTVLLTRLLAPAGS